MPQNSSSPKSGPEFQMFCRCLWFAAKLLSSYPHNTAFSEGFWHTVIHLLAQVLHSRNILSSYRRLLEFYFKKNLSRKKPDPLIWEKEGEGKKKKSHPPKSVHLPFLSFQVKKTSVTGKNAFKICCRCLVFLQNPQTGQATG